MNKLKIQYEINNTFMKLAKMTNSLLFGNYDTDVDQEVANLIDAEMVLRTAMTQDGDEVILTIGRLRDKWKAIDNVSPNTINAEALVYIENCLEALTPDAI